MNKMKVKIRRQKDWEVKPEAEQIDNQIYYFSRGWLIPDEDSSIYGGETAWIPYDENYPKNAPVWLASGDLENV